MSAHPARKTVEHDTPTPSPGNAAADRAEALLDAAVEDTFPASDPVAGAPSGAASAASEAHADAELDEGIALTFPASDPVAVSGITKVVPKKPA